MEKYAKVVTNDPKFKRMLILELEDIGINVKEDLKDLKKDTPKNNYYIIADLDFCFEEDVAEFQKNACVIGFSNLYENDIPEKVSHCSFFLHRPFRMPELQSLLASDAENIPKRISERHTKANISFKSKQVGYLTVDHTNKCAVLGDNRVALSDNEYKVLALLCEKRGETVTRENLSSSIGATDSNMCDVYVCFLRKKIDNKFGVKLIYTVRGQGYMLK